MRVRKIGSRWVAGGAGIGVILAMIAGTAPLSPSASGAATIHVTTPATCTGSPLLASSEPSGVLPLGPRAFPGDTRTYCNDFPNSVLPLGWEKFTGQPKGDAASLFEPWHVTVRGGLLRLNTYRDPLEHWNWVTGGVCQCGLARAYGAYYVRARITAVGPSNVALLWPKNNSWPPEVDFLETWQQTNSTTSTLHFAIPNNPGDHKVQRRITMNLLAYHTWGVVWTPKSIKFTVGTYTYWTITDPTEIPTISMTLDLQQQVWCGIFVGGCPAYASSMLVDWVAEFVPNQYLPSKVTRARPTIPDLAG